MPLGRLRARTRLRSDEGRVYEVDSHLGEGGFGTTYRGTRLDESGERSTPVCIKLCKSSHDWHGEAFFGKLLAHDPRVVKLLDSFVATTGSGTAQVRRHVLIFELMDEGTVWDMIDDTPSPWTETRVLREIKRLLSMLAELHYVGVTHRDLKPDNVYFRKGRLVLGDFGITKMHLDPKHGFASAFAPGFAPSNVLESSRWAAADDVFQVGLLAATLASGSIWWNDEASVPSISQLQVSDELKSWIWHATGARAQRYWDAGEALDALDSLRTISLRPGRAPRSLSSHCIVFTGRIDRLPRDEATLRARAAGAHVQAGITDSTSLVVLGRIKAGSAGANEGLKLFAARERLRRGQAIKVISGEQFKRLAPD